MENLQTFAHIYRLKELGDLSPETATQLHIAMAQGMIKRILYPSNET
jgi:type I restriction enzyme, R subunit